MKIFEEHETYLKNNNPNYLNSGNSRNFLYKIFEKNESIPLIKNDIIKSRFDLVDSLKLPSKNTLNQINNSHIGSFYRSLYRTEANFWDDFDSFLKFQSENNTIQKNKENQLKYDELSSKISKLFSGSAVNYFKFYTRCHTVINYT